MALTEQACKNARYPADRPRLRLAVGNDPGLARAEAKELQRLQRRSTFEGVARAWFEHWKAPRTARHTEYVMQRLEADVFPAIGARPISEVTAPQLLAMAKGIGR